MRKILSLWIVLALLTWVSKLPAQTSLPKASEQVLGRFEARIAQQVEQDDVGSITAAVVSRDRVVWTGSFGWADREKKIAADAESIYRVGSISKSFTALVVVQAAERGLLGLDDAVERYFPEVRKLSGYPASRPITFRQLASHTAGLTREPRLIGAATGPIGQWEEKILASIPATSFQTSPGEKYSYSNIGFGMLGLAVSRAVGKPFMELVRDQVFRPLQMQSSEFVLRPEMQRRLTVGYANRGERVNTEWPAREHSGRGYKVPNGGIYSTVGDLARFIGAMNGTSEVKILNAQSRAEMMRLQTPEGGSGYGLGFSVRQEENGLRLIGHGGSVAGYNAYLIFDPVSKLGVVLLRNYNQGRTNLGRAARELLVELVGLEAGR
ncbi:MAG: serine hydrolase domain-containing protein [Acidobacteriota bacterium]